MMTTHSDLEKCLQEFRRTFNNNARVKKLIKGWDRSVMLEATDTGTQFSLLITDLELTEVKPGMIEWEYPIHIQAEEHILIRVFSGEYNPATALIDGALAVFSAERDKVKLEAIAMVIWGL
jgi:hypothetical protein